MRLIFFIIAITILATASSAFAYTYEKKLTDSHIIHIVRIDPGQYRAEIKKANDGGIGRQTVSSIAQKSNAVIAINGGFFEIGDKRDGMPSGSLVINGKVYNCGKRVQPLLIIEDGVVSVSLANPKSYIQKNASIVSGIPMLINDGKIPQELFEKKTEFYSSPHARTAIGIDAEGKVIIVVAEHYYKKDIMAITIGEVQSLMKENGGSYAVKYKKQSPGEITLTELKQILREEFAPHNPGRQGLTILELAKLMKDLGCQYGLNLDGGGSSTLWLEGEVVNTIFGDKDENIGQQVERPVSDVIVFRKK